MFGVQFGDGPHYLRELVVVCCSVQSRRSLRSASGASDTSEVWRPFVRRRRSGRMEQFASGSSYIDFAADIQEGT